MPRCCSFYYWGLVLSLDCWCQQPPPLSCRGLSGATLMQVYTEWLYIHTHCLPGLYIHLQPAAPAPNEPYCACAVEHSSRGELPALFVLISPTRVLPVPYTPQTTFAEDATKSTRTYLISPQRVASKVASRTPCWLARLRTTRLDRSRISYAYKALYSYAGAWTSKSGDAMLWHNMVRCINVLARCTCNIGCVMANDAMQFAPTCMSLHSPALCVCHCAVRVLCYSARVLYLCAPALCAVRMPLYPCAAPCVFLH